MQNPWDVRPRNPQGSRANGLLFTWVGAALSAWETLESTLAELFDALVSNVATKAKSNRAGFAAFTAVSSSSARTELLRAAVPRALLGKKEIRERTQSFIDKVSNFGARRNEIAHGRVLSLGEFGFYLCPNNTMPHKWSKQGHAKYQYTALDVEYYAKQFLGMITECEAILADIYAQRCTDDGHNGSPSGSATDAGVASIQEG